MCENYEKLVFNRELSQHRENNLFHSSDERFCTAARQTFACERFRLFVDAVQIAVVVRPSSGPTKHRTIAPMAC